MTYAEDYGWQRQFLPAAKSIVGQLVVVEADWREDRQHATDLLVLAEPGGLRVAMRMRRRDQLARYWHEFTLRVRRPSGAVTELSKIAAGWGSHLLYGFASERRGVLAGWLLGDLDVFRAYRRDYLDRYGTEPGRARRNSDESSDFRAYHVADLPRPFVLQWKGPRMQLGAADAWRLMPMRCATCGSLPVGRYLDGSPRYGCYDPTTHRPIEVPA